MSVRVAPEMTPVDEMIPAVEMEDFDANTGAPDIVQSPKLPKPNLNRRQSYKPRSEEARRQSMVKRSQMSVASLETDLKAYGVPIASLGAADFFNAVDQVRPRPSSRLGERYPMSMRMRDAAR